jgi:DNA-binding SARP family transcriptional activator
MTGVNQPAQFGVLGPFCIRLGEGAVEPPGPGLRLLLGMLLLVPGEPVERDRLVELLWGPEHGSAAALHTSVSRLRDWLRRDLPGPVAIERTAAGYRARIDPGLVDAVRFRDLLARAAGARSGSRIETLTAAMALWRGPVLGNAAEWLSRSPAVVALEQDRIEAVRELTDLCLGEGRPAVAVPHLRRVAEAYPFDEPTHALLIDVLTASGRPGEAARAYAQIRDRLAEELGVMPSTTLAEAGTRAAIIGVAPPRSPVVGVTGGPAAAPVPGRPRRPAELPPDVAAFTGRDTEVELLCHLLHPGKGEQARIVAIDGVAGVGKSALAAHVSHRLARRFPDGQLYVNLHGAAGTPPLAPAEILQRWLRTFGAMDDGGPRPPGEPGSDASARWRSLLAGKRVLLLLDNASSAEQVRPLLPAHRGCAALITSRTAQSTLDEAFLVHLRPLAEVEALTLFRRLVGDDRVSADLPAARRITALCGHLPLLLRIVAARLGARPDWPIHAVAARLADSERRLDELQIGTLSVRASLAAGLNEAGRDANRTFALLGAIGVAEPELPLIASLAGVSLPVAEVVMERLVDARLVESPGPGRYAMHALPRLYSRERADIDATPGERAAARRRALDHYLALARQASMLLIVGHRPAAESGQTVEHRRARSGWAVEHPAGFELADRSAAATWVDANAPALPVVMADLAAQPHLATDVARFAVIAHPALAARGHWPHLAELHRIAVTAAAPTGDGPLRAHVHGLLGVAYGQLGRPTDSRTELDRALHIWTELGDERQMAETLNRLGLLASLPASSELIVSCRRALPR